MRRSGDAPAGPKNNQWLILGASLLYTTIASYFAMNRDDSKVTTEQVSQVRERIRAVEVRLDGLERREGR